MRSLILKMSLSADGFVCGPHGEINWLFESSDPTSKASIVKLVSEAGAHLMGSRTYQDMAAYWPYSSDPIAPGMNAVPKFIFTRREQAQAPGTEPTTQAILDAVKASGPGAVTPTLDIVKSWQQPTFLRGDMAAHVRTLKAGDGKPLLAHGGASFARSLIATGLIDEYRLVVHPVILGKGQPIFTEVTVPFALELISSTSYPRGIVSNVYRPKNAPAAQG